MRSGPSPIRRLVLVSVALICVIVGVLLARGMRGDPPIVTGDPAAGARGEESFGGLLPGADPAAAGRDPDLGAAGAQAAPGDRPSVSAGYAGETDWWAVLDTLDQRRAVTVGNADLGAIRSYAVASSDFGRSETALLDQLLGDGLRPRGWRTRLIAIEHVEGPRTRDAGEPAVGLTVVDERAAFELVDEAGIVVRKVAASGKRRWRVTLVRPSSVGGADAGAVPGSAASSSTTAQRGGATGPGAGMTRELEGGGQEQGLADARSAVADDLAETVPGAAGQGLTDPSSDPVTPPGRPASGQAGEPNSAAASPSTLDEDAQGWRIVSVELVA